MAMFEGLYLGNRRRPFTQIKQKIGMHWALPKHYNKYAPHQSLTLAEVMDENLYFKQYMFWIIYVINYKIPTFDISVSRALRRSR